MSKHLVNLPEINFVVLVPPQVRKQLRLGAIKRGTTVDKLACAIIERVAEDGLVDAVLDDMT